MGARRVSESKSTDICCREHRTWARNHGERQLIRLALGRVYLSGVLSSGRKRLDS